MNSRSQVPRHRWRAVLLLCGWLVATGTHWDVVQVVAWGRMWINNLRTESPAAALATTFSPEGMCEVCHVVREARTSNPDQAAIPTESLEKAPLLPLVIAAFELPAVAGRTVIARVRPLAPPARRAEPPVPPPRAA